MRCLAASTTPGGSSRSRALTMYSASFPVMSAAGARSCASAFAACSGKAAAATSPPRPCNMCRLCISYSPPREEGGLRHQENFGEAHLSAADGVVAHKSPSGRERRLFLMATPYRACAGSARRPLQQRRLRGIFFMSRPPPLTRRDYSRRFVSLCLCGSKSRQTKCTQVQSAFSINDQFRHGFADRCRMLEAMTRARRYDHDIGMLWMHVHHKPGIRKACIEAGHGVQTSVAHARSSHLNVLSIYPIDFFPFNLSIDVGDFGFEAALLRSNFYAASQSVNRRKSINEVVVISTECPNKHRKLSRQIIFNRRIQVEPEKYLAIYLKKGSKFRDH